MAMSDKISQPREIIFHEKTNLWSAPKLLNFVQSFQPPVRPHSFRLHVQRTFPRRCLHIPLLSNDTSVVKGAFVCVDGAFPR
eukprot:69127-Amorphochlora_amoeboformis.AAC.2